MLLAQPQSRWIRSERANSLFLYSSWVVVCVGFFMAFMLSPRFAHIEAMKNGDLLLRVLGGALGILGAPVSLVIWFGMVVFCAREDRSPIGIKILWFVLFFATASFGAAAYFFAIYRKKVDGTPVLAAQGQ